jgi:hypothetical protein
LTGLLSAPFSSPMLQAGDLLVPLCEVLELARERYRMVTVKTAIEKPMRMEILGLERLVGVDALFNLVNTRQSPSGSKEMRTRSGGSNFLPLRWLQWEVLSKNPIQSVVILDLLDRIRKNRRLKLKRCTNFGLSCDNEARISPLVRRNRSRNLSTTSSTRGFQFIFQNAMLSFASTRRLSSPIVMAISPTFDQSLRVFIHNTFLDIRHHRGESIIIIITKLHPIRIPDCRRIGLKSAHPFVLGNFQRFNIFFALLGTDAKCMACTAYQGIRFLSAICCASPPPRMVAGASISILGYSLSMDSYKCARAPKTNL